MPTVLVLAPMRTELSPIVRRLHLDRDRASSTWTGRCGTADVTAAVAGVGTDHAAAVTQQLLARARPDHVVVAGVAGGLAPDLRVGDLVVPATVRSLDDGRTHRASTLGDHERGGRVLGGELLTSTVMHGWDVLEAEAATGALAIDMETAAIAAVCAGAEVPWTAIRGLSDVVRDGTVDGSTLAFVHEDGSTNLGGVARYLGRHPTKIPALATMGRDSATATSAVARLLQQELLALTS